MLYIFHVDTGTTITFDIKHALQSVSVLKEAIERECGVAVDHQVLLMNGGEILATENRVCSYSAGTDTNPIYLFSKASIMNPVPPTPSIDYGSDVDLAAQIEMSMAMPPTYQTLVARAQLAAQCCSLARDVTRICERLVHDQHLQQQGWAAVVANLDDIIANVRGHWDASFQSYTTFLNECPKYMHLIMNINQDVQVLKKIPVLPPLRSYAETFLKSKALPRQDQQQQQQQEQQQSQVSQQNSSSAADSGATMTEVSDEDSSSTETASGVVTVPVPVSDIIMDTTQTTQTLFEWIAANDNEHALGSLLDSCKRCLETFGETYVESLKAEFTSIMKEAAAVEMREIKGLGDRLYTLEQLMLQMKKLVHEQSELAQGFNQNKVRVSNLNDDSVLPDLCTSHQEQLKVMLKNHNQLRDIRRRCTKAKEELSASIHRRLKQITIVESRVIDLQGKLMMNNEWLRRMRKHFDIVRQIHSAPQMYMNAIAEVVRRRTFSQAFLMWATNLACQLLSVHSEEVERRREFQSKFDGHFLAALFPGLEDVPPAFATQAPSVFDNGLPKLSAEDMEALRLQLPDLAVSMSTPDLNSITQFFSKSVSESGSDSNKEKESTSMPLDPPAKEGDELKPSLANARGVFESETDTEEFEKIGQGTTDSRATSYEGATKPPLQQQQQQLDSITQATPASSSHQQKQSEVGASMSTSSTSTNISRLNRSTSSSSSSSQPLQPQLASPYPCDGQQQQQPQLKQKLTGSGGSSPSVGNVAAAGMAADFLGTEFYMDESLPSSLSEHLTDSQHQAIMSLLQENLGNTQDEVERLRGMLRDLKAVSMEALMALRGELTGLKEQALLDRKGAAKLMEEIGKTVEMHASALREREQWLTVDHELELSDLKKTQQSKDEQIDGLKRSLLDKETEIAEQERLIVTMRQKFEGEQQELMELKSFCRMLEERLEQSKIEKETAVRENEETKLLEVNKLQDSLEECKKELMDLKEKLMVDQTEHEKAIKDMTEKLAMEYKTQLDTIRSRFKLMAASTMERSPSDSSLEKIERPDMIEIVNHETILEETKKRMELEKEDAVRMAVEQLRAANELLQEREHELEMSREREMDKTHCYESTLERMMSAESIIQKLEAEIKSRAHQYDADREKIEQQQKLIRHLETERDDLKQKLNDDMLKMSQTELGESLKALEDDEEPEKDEVRVSESKKVRLEAVGDATLSYPSGRPGDSLEADNKWLSSELKATRETKERLESKVEKLENERVRLELELVKERSKRNLSAESLSSSSIVSTSDGSRDKDMNASVSVVSETSSSSAATTSQRGVDVGTSTERRSRREVSSSASSSTLLHAVRDKLSQSTSCVPQLQQQSRMNYASCGPIGIVQPSRINFVSCNPGDVVLVLWEQVHRNYIVLQESATFYFLNSDCLADLDLKLGTDGLPTKLHAVAEVVEKEYCSARKSENRYRVPQGTKFYRVRVKPLQRQIPAGKSQ